MQCMYVYIYIYNSHATKQTGEPAQISRWFTVYGRVPGDGSGSGWGPEEGNKGEWGGKGGVGGNSRTYRRRPRKAAQDPQTAISGCGVRAHRSVVRCQYLILIPGREGEVQKPTYRMRGKPAQRTRERLSHIRNTVSHMHQISLPPEWKCKKDAPAGSNPRPGGATGPSRRGRRVRRPGAGARGRTPVPSSRLGLRSRPVPSGRGGMAASAAAGWFWCRACLSS